MNACSAPRLAGLLKLADSPGVKRAVLERVFADLLTVLT